MTNTARSPLAGRSSATHLLIRQWHEANEHLDSLNTAAHHNDNVVGE